MRLRLVQKDINNTNLGDFIEAAHGTGVDLLCFGELAATGCLYTGRPVPSIEQIVSTFGKYTFGIMFGAPRLSNGALFNSYIYYEDGLTQTYDKVNLFPPFREDQVFEAGRVPGLFETPHGNFGVAICYDIRFDEVFKRFAELGLSRIVIPAAFPLVRIDQWREILIRRARETGATVIGINAVGDDGRNLFGGSSMVVGPDGAVLAQAEEAGERIIDVDL